jgi:Kef-type K+ transport system membrane component KefB
MDFSHIAIILVVAAGFGIVAKIFKQPLIIGYLLAGFFLAYFGVIDEAGDLTSLGQIGVALLLFLLGVEMKLSELPSIGKAALITGIGQITFTSLIGYFIAILLGYSSLSSIYIAVALTFSSTIIMVKLLSEKKDLSSLYGRISIGFLLVQDFVAVVILMFLAGLGQGGTDVMKFVLIAVKALILISSVWILSRKILPRFFYKITEGSNELLFIVSVAWALGVAAFVSGPMGFSFEIGGFLAGIALSNLPEHLQIASKTKPLRDFFLTIFFVLLGTKLVISGSILPILAPAGIFSLFVLIGNPFIVLIILGILGYKARTGFLSGLTVAQISEFSLILVAMGASFGHLGEEEVALVVLVGVVTMVVSTYMILGSDKLYKRLRSTLTIFERKSTSEKYLSSPTEFKNHTVIVGSDNTGKKLVSYFKKLGTTFVVVDFDPRVYEYLYNKSVPVVFGDVEDPEVYDLAGISKSDIVVSTIANLEVNLTLLEELKFLKKKPITIFTAKTHDEAVKLYNKGATYVVVPDVTAGDYIKRVLDIPGMGKKRLTKMGETHNKRLLKLIS